MVNKGERVIFHIDVNSAFLSWEAVRRVREGGEDLRLIPAAIGGDAHKRTGVILAKSIPAKECGVKTGEPVAAALKKCPDLILAKPDFQLYKENSKGFIEICGRYTPTLEQFSIDECFLDMTGMHRLYDDLVHTAVEIKNTVKAELGFTVNVGIGSNKLLAKMASDFEKPDKVHTLFLNEIEEKMWHLPVSELYGVGRATYKKLKALNINTIGELANSSVQLLQDSLGVKASTMVHNFANGIDRSEVMARRAEAKGYSISRTLEDDVKDYDEAKRIIAKLVDRVAFRMRSNGKYTSCIGVTIRDNNFNDKSHQRTISGATDSTDEIFDIAWTLFKEVWNKSVPLRLIGVSLTLISSGETQLSLFEIVDENKRKKSRLVDEAVDEIKKKYGTDKIKRGSSL